MAQMEQAIHTLPANQRQVMILRDIEGIDSEEICNLLHITQTNQRVLLHRGRSKVRWALNDYIQNF
jgi:RNA polymerase sigma-70 factor (ECF subfamily)